MLLTVHCFWVATEQQEERTTMELVYMDGKKEPYTLSSIVAECARIAASYITKTIRKHQVRFEQLGKVGFKNPSMERRPV